MEISHLLVVNPELGQDKPPGPQGGDEVARQSRPARATKRQTTPTPSVSSRQERNAGLGRASPRTRGGSRRKKSGSAHLEGGVLVHAHLMESPSGTIQERDGLGR